MRNDRPARELMAVSRSREGQSQDAGVWQCELRRIPGWNHPPVACSHELLQIRSTSRCLARSSPADYLAQEALSLRSDWIIGAQTCSRDPNSEFRRTKFAQSVARLLRLFNILRNVFVTATRDGPSICPKWWRPFHELTAISTATKTREIRTQDPCCDARSRQVYLEFRNPGEYQFTSVSPSTPADITTDLIRALRATSLAAGPTASLGPLVRNPDAREPLMTERSAANNSALREIASDNSYTGRTPAISRRPL